MVDDKTHFKGWRIPGPIPCARGAPGDDESLDAISGHFKIFQRKKGHRFSTDDVLCAGYAGQWAPRVERYCDLGSGIGSIAMMLIWRRRPRAVLTVEAQDISLALQRRSLTYNGLSDLVDARSGDLRDDQVFKGHAPFDLVTGSPPYWADTDALGADSDQAKGARLEQRGGVRDYAARAAKILAPAGVFVLVHQAAHDARVRDAISAADLSLVRTRAVRFKAGVPAKTSGAQLYLAMRREDLPARRREVTVTEAPLTIRAKDGTVDDEYAAFKLSLGFPP